MIQKTQVKPAVLIVDDERLNINVLNGILKDEYEIKVAMNGAEALIRTDTGRRPDIILLDISMPELNGFEVCERLQADPDTSDIPIIFVTASRAEADEVAGLALGGSDFISKPVRPEVVRARVKSQVNRLKQRRKLKEMNQELLDRSNTDGLTGISNRRRFNEFIGQEWFRSMRSKKPLGLVMIDIDLFKDFNDHYGHVAGDGCIKEMARTFEKHLFRPNDLIARYGGEEFICVLPETDLEGVRSISRVLIGAVRELKIPHAVSTVTDTVTISIGATSVIPSRDYEPERLIEAADYLLYQSKRNGRNCITVKALDSCAASLLSSSDC